jgi:hypothetical protein
VVVKGSTVAACRIDRHYEELFGVVDEWREVETPTGRIASSILVA